MFSLIYSKPIDTTKAIETIKMNVYTNFCSQIKAEAALEGVDTEIFIRFLETEHETNPDVQASDNRRCLPYVTDRSLLRKSDSKTRQMRKNICAAVERYCSHDPIM